MQLISPDPTKPKKLLDQVRDTLRLKHYNITASTQNQALSALLFLYRYVLKQPLSESIEAVRARQSKHLPTVLTVDEVQRLLQCLECLLLSTNLQIN
jgi:site-specific recombinase XerD